MYSDDAGRIARSVAGHPYRRVLLSVLDGHTAPVSVRDLACAILAFDCSNLVSPSPALDEDGDRPGVETMTAQLHHVHLPRLASAGLLEYDTATRTITDWRHPPVGDRWVTAPPIDSLARVIADARSPSRRADRVARPSR